MKSEHLYKNGIIEYDEIKNFIEPVKTTINLGLRDLNNFFRVDELGVKRDVLRKIINDIYLEILDGDSYYDSSVGASITTGAFYKNNITGIAMPQKLTYIGSYAFEENKLTSLVFSDSVGIIGTGALSDMPTLSDVTLGKGLKRIGGGAFYNTNLTSRKAIFYCIFA